MAVLLPAASATAAPLAQWRFDEAGGQIAVDAGPSHLDGELGFEPVADAGDPVRIPGAAGGALHFDGDAFVSLPRSDVLAPATLTAEAVVRAPASPGAWRYIVSRGSNGCVAGAYGLYTGAAGGVALYVFDGERYLVSATARSSDVWNGAWHRVTGTFDGAALLLYVDGRRVGAAMPAPLRIGYDRTSSRAQIGQYGGDCNLGFDGDIDAVTLWGSALSADEIAGSPQPGLPGTDPGPGTRPPLPAADQGAVIPGDAGTDAPAPPAGETGCAVRTARSRVRAGRRQVIRVRVSRLRGAHRHVRVVARKRGKRKALSSGRIGAKGRARLVLRVRRAQTVVIAVAGRPGCAPAYVRVTR